MDYLWRIFDHNAAIRYQHVSDKEKWHKQNGDTRYTPENYNINQPKRFITLMTFRYDHKLSYNAAMALSSFVALEQNIVALARSFITF